jgi:hypothetical protein
MFKWIEIGDGDIGVWVGASEGGLLTAGISHYPDSDFKYRYSVAEPDSVVPGGPYKVFVHGTRPTLEMCQEAADAAARQYLVNKAARREYTDRQYMENKENA